MEDFDFDFRIFFGAAKKKVSAPIKMVATKEPNVVRVLGIVKKLIWVIAIKTKTTDILFNPIQKYFK
ncbi:MAG: hypothetical protein ABJH57_09605 [Cyclobacteriaceae bacterium]